MRPITQLRSAVLAVAVPVLLILSVNAHADCSANPMVSISAEVDDDGIVTGLVTYEFFDTTLPGQRGVEVSVDEPTGSGFLGGFQPADASGEWPFTHHLSCKPSGTYVYRAKAIACGSRIANASDTVPFVTTPTVSISYDGPDEFGDGEVTVEYNFPNTSSPAQRSLQHSVIDPNGFSGLGPNLQPDEQEGTWVFPFSMACRATGTYTHKITSQHCNGTVKTDTDDVEIESDPTVSISASVPDDNGVIDVAVSFDFPNTNSHTQRRVDVTVEDTGGTGLLATFQPLEQSGTEHFPYNVACATPGERTIIGSVWSCGRGPVEDEKPITISHTPTVSVSIAHSPLEAVVDYSFIGTGSPSQRTLRVEWVGGGLIGEIHPTTATGVARFPLNACGTVGTIRATATACNNEQAVDEEAVGSPKKPIVTVTLRKGALVPGTGKRMIEGRLDYNMGDADSGWTTRADLLSWKDADGQSYAGGNVLPPAVPPQRVGFRTFSFLPNSRAQQVTVRGTAESCAGRGTHDASIECGCEAATQDPVHFIDGNVRVTDGDPLPRIAGHGLTRTYNSDEQVEALFGRGWTTLFDRRLILNTDGAEQIVSIVTASNEVVTFRGTGSVYHQTWPTAQSAAGVLSYDAGIYRHRPAGSNEESVFSAATGRLLALRDFQTGHEAQFAYDVNGVPQSLTDSWSGVSWTLTIEPGHRRVSSIAVNSSPSLVWTYAYDGTGNLATVTAPGSATWRTYEYVADRMTASRDALGNLIESHTYDGDGFGISSTGPSDEISSIEYLPGSTAGERLTQVTYNNTTTAEYTLRVVGGAWRLVRAEGGCASCGSGDDTYVRDERGRVVRQQSGSGYVTTTVYANDVVVSVEDSLKPVGCDPQTDAQQCRLDPDALAAATLEPTSASVTTIYEYDDPLWPDRPTRIVRPSVVSPAVVREEYRYYHPATGALTEVSHCAQQGDVIHCHGPEWTFYEGNGAGATPAFDPGGVFLSSWLAFPQPSGAMKSGNGPRTDAQDVTSYVYYPIDSTVPVLLRSRLAAVKNAAGHITRYESYDVFGNVTRVVDPNGAATEMSYDVLGRPLTTTTKAIPGCNTTLDPLCSLDLTGTRVYSPAAGPLEQEIRPRGGITVYTYDARGRVHTISRGDSVNDLYERIETTYDPLTGKKSSESRQAFLDNEWVEQWSQFYVYDGRARLQSVVHADSEAIHYTYDAEDRVKTVRDENHATPNTTYAYDAAGRVSRVTQTLATAPGGTITTEYTYHLDGNLASVTDPNGNVTTYLYSDHGNLMEVHSPVSGATVYDYDKASNVVYMLTENALTLREFDALNRVTTSTSEGNGETEIVTSSYDDPTAGRFGIGRLTSSTDPSGEVDYSYERRGLLREETRTVSAGPHTFETSYTYDADGNRNAITYPSGLLVEYGFDHAGRPTNATGSVAEASYLPFGPLTQLTFENGTVQYMSYDTRYRMTNNDLSTIDPTPPFRPLVLASYVYEYDAASNITAITDYQKATYNRTFEYDDLNRLTVANTGSALWETGSYSWDAMGNIQSMSLGSAAGRSSTFAYLGTTPKLDSVTTNSVTKVVEYDAAGNETSYIATRGYSPRNLTAEIVDAGSNPRKLRNTYDGRGIRTVSDNISPFGVSSKRVSLYSPELHLMAVTGPNTATIDYEIVWFGNRPVAQVSAAATRYTFTDHLGTPFIQTAGNATVIWRAEYEPFGNIFAMRTGTRSDQPLRFPGQELAVSWERQEEENYNIHRWYRSAWGRYTQADPIGLNGGLNVYAYANGSPTTYTDRLGLDPTMETISPVAKLLAHLLDKFYEDIQQRRVDGHQRFPGEENSAMRHCTISCEAAQVWGKPLVRFAGGANEIQGFVRWDILNIWSRITGKSPWAFQFDDLANNEQGFSCVDKLAAGGTKNCSTCEDCCAGKCCEDK